FLTPELHGRYLRAVGGDRVQVQPERNLRWERTSKIETAYIGGPIRPRAFGISITAPRTVTGTKNPPPLVTIHRPEVSEPQLSKRSRVVRQRASFPIGYCAMRRMPGQ